eukprot:CAMPEP_0202696080 /NCGR_PEP_ID=MMETSP1385-20130828/9446_1 /ASSEMBLY_ACC=CAM_ASM_000861 /TAXON_ID=933848 /ORGANISM="Elphidium margaritaceum" /LENGTH=505 /DNA_ID=CAMNT_0049352185 /DNA_START=28 /DNA_END=1545 /DNA_ORIENTATION=+
MSTTSVSLLAFFLHHAYAQLDVVGSWNHVCALGVDDPMPTVCSSAGMTKTDSGGKIECGGNFDCCLCQSMICGSSDGSKTCDELNCNGDSGCFGVRDIQIYGSRSDGAVISCNGDESCNSTKIIGSNIKEVICSGDGACARSTFMFNCMTSEPCTLSCGGEESCAGQPDFERALFDDTYLSTQMVIENTAGLECGDQACKYGKFVFLNNVGGGSIFCDGYNACIEAQITINNIESIHCSSADACKDANILVVDPQRGFYVECAAAGACTGLRLQIIVNNDVDLFQGIMCGDAACLGATISVTNNGAQFLWIESFECESPESCKQTTLDFDGGDGGIGFMNCKCGERAIEACTGILGIDSCMSGVTQLNCAGAQSCQNLQQQVPNVANGFQVLCNDVASCRAMWLVILLNNNAAVRTTQIKGYRCGSNEACKDAVIQINNEQSGNVQVVVDKIECFATSSCENATFKIVGNVKINRIICMSSTACVNCVVHDVMSNIVTPCQSFLF